VPDLLPHPCRRLWKRFMSGLSDLRHSKTRHPPFNFMWPVVVLWHIDPLLGNDRETNNDVTAVTRQRPARSNGNTVGSGIAPWLYQATDRVQFSECSAVIWASEWCGVGWWASEFENCYGSVFVSCCCKKLVAETRGSFGNPEEGEHPPFRAVTRQLPIQTPSIGTHTGYNIFPFPKLSITGSLLFKKKLRIWPIKFREKSLNSAYSCV
jgi:hypothetical protein